MEKKNNVAVGEKAPKKSRIYEDKYLRDAFDITKVEGSSNGNMVERSGRII